MFRFRTNPEFRAPLTAGGSSTFGYLLAAGVGLIVALFVLMAFSASRGGADTPPDTYLLPDDARYPEGIAADNKSGTFYVSSFADGSIYRGDVRKEDVKRFLAGGQDGRMQAIGLTLAEEGRLYVAGGGTGKVFIYETSSNNPDLIRSFSTQGASGFLNDVTVNPRSGDTYITDSFVPILWRVPADAVTDDSPEGQLDPWLDLSRTAIQYKEGFNLNGIVATPDGRYLLTVQSNTGNLYRIDTQTEQVTPVELGGAKLTNGDGLVLTDNTLYVIRNQGVITKITLDKNFKSGDVAEEDTSVPFPEDFPTTGALVGGRLLVVNSQFNTEGGPVGGTTPPEIPFTVSAMRAP
jgi:sugar lactone lactonase YvrE